MENKENEYEKIEQKLEEFLGVEVGELREKIIEKAIWFNKDCSKMVVLRVYLNGSYDVGIGQQGSYDGLSNEERLWVEFSLIEPWDLPDFESVVQDENGDWVDQDNGDVFDEDELLDAVKTSVSSGFYDDFEYEWEKFLREFDEWYKALKGDGEWQNES